MKKFLLFNLLIALNFLAQAQVVNSTSLPSITNTNKEEVQSLFNQGVLLEEEQDSLGFSHRTVQQTNEAIDIEGAIIKIITRPDGTMKKVGNRVDIQKPIPANVLRFEAALVIAMQTVQTDYFYWENEAMQRLIKELENDPGATFYPQNKLVWLDPQFSHDGNRYKLAYKIELFYHAASDHKTVYVDAEQGSILLEIEGCHEVSVEGTAETRYHGTRTIITDSLGADSFVLYDHSRGGGIETLNIRTLKSEDSAVSFVDDDNHWDHDNKEMDNAAGDVHWGSEMTYDYFMKSHGRNSFDGKGTKILSYVHYDKNWVNASWNGKYARYGDGSNNPLTSIDVVAHELTHGVTGTSSGLIYRNESGALNESFSDIFGTAVEFYAAPAEANWNIGMANFYLREMGNPKKFSHPNCYNGRYWYTGTGDNGGVHINSGVQNFWFYLLCNGGEGVNDLGNPYKVDSIGMEKAAKIAFRNLVYYLTPSSTFADARSGSIEAAKDLFGACSPEVAQVVNAWYAVGVGADSDNKDLAMIRLHTYDSQCEMGKEDVVVDFAFSENACDSIIPIGAEINFFFQLGNQDTIEETLKLKSAIKLFDTITYTFKQKADFSQVARYQVRAWVKFNEDKNPVNDSSLVIEVTHRANPSKDDVIGFEPKDKEHEDVLYHLTENSHGRVEVTIPARKTGIRGLGFTGEPSGRIRDFEPPASESEIFSTHTQQIAKMCMCVDARNWTNVKLSFDLRQSHASIYYDHLKNYEPRLMTSLRVTVDGQQIDTIFHPDTVNSDPWVNHVMNLDQYAGTAFELCFEGKHFISRSSFSSENVGDNSYVDNINLHHDGITPEPTAYNIVWGPNPTESIIYIQSYQSQTETLQFVFRDALGRLVYETALELQYGVNNVPLNLGNLANGMYFIETTIHGETRVEKIAIH